MLNVTDMKSKIEFKKKIYFENFIYDRVRKMAYSMVRKMAYGRVRAGDGGL